MRYGEMTANYTDDVVEDVSILSNEEIAELQDEHNVNFCDRNEIDNDPGQRESCYVESWDHGRVHLR